MKSQKFFRGAVLALSTTMAAGTASAALPVVDPTNLVQNYTTAIASVKNEINTAQNLIQSVKSTVALAKSTATLNGISSSIADVKQAMQLYRSLKNVDTQLTTALEESQRFTQSLVSGYGASNSSWAEYLATRDGIATKQRAATVARMESINESLADTATRRAQIVRQLETVQGQTGAIQTVGASLDVIIGQNQQLISVMKSSAIAADEALISKAKDEQDDARANAMMAEYQKRPHDSAANFGKK